jgi:hypothetical protein
MVEKFVEIESGRRDDFNALSLTAMGVRFGSLADIRAAL